MVVIYPNKEEQPELLDIVQQAARPGSGKREGGSQQKFIRHIKLEGGEYPVSWVQQRRPGILMVVPGPGSEWQQWRPRQQSGAQGSELRLVPRQQVWKGNTRELQLREDWSCLSVRVSKAHFGSRDEQNFCVGSISWPSYEYLEEAGGLRNAQ